MEQSVWFVPRDVRRELAALGLTLEPLQDAVLRGFTAGISRTENDAPTATGFYHWNETVRTLRENLAASSWRRRNENGLPTMVNPDKSLAVCVSSGDENTGLADKNPSTKNHKGPRTAEFVALNFEQIDMFPDLRPVVESNQTGSSTRTWTLLFCTDTDRHELRSELSLPILIGVGGQINGWIARIILPVIRLDGGGGTETAEPDFGPDVDIDIRRRA